MEVKVGDEEREAFKNRKLPTPETILRKLFAEGYFEDDPETLENVRLVLSRAELQRSDSNDDRIP
jgi:hypothetical protein